jgi:hypothetical protein
MDEIVVVVAERLQASEQVRDIAMVAALNRL